jgi:hypothetical protein
MLIKGLRYFILLFVILLAVNSFAQHEYPIYWIQFTDKSNTPYSIDQPEDFLSQRAIDRRNRQQIGISADDLPVDPVYLDSLAGLGARIINISKWFNGVLAEIESSELVEGIEMLSFIQGSPLLVKPVATDKRVSRISGKFDPCKGMADSIYGLSLYQVEMLNGNTLHEQGYRGEGMLVAVMDAGFTNANQISSLQHIWEDGRILAVRDFVKDGLDIFNSHDHGTKVFSIIGGKGEQVLYGSAPEAEFMLLRTEDGLSEYIIEEYNWIAGIEFADSLGADVVNSSLGYSIFDTAFQNHSYEDMDGHTVPVSRAAYMAAQRGMLIVTSAGNSGRDDWYYITAPADAEDILAVGATDPEGEVMDFSSRGPSYDGRIKPDICAQGYRTIAQHPEGQFIYCAGTSCSAPVIAGMVACLWQAMPQETNKSIIEYVKRSGSRYLDPDGDYGYGIPGFLKSAGMINEKLRSTANDKSMFTVFPNPTRDELFLSMNTPAETSYQEITLSISDMSGRKIFTEEQAIANEIFAISLQGVPELASGLYKLIILYGEETHSVLFSKF